MSRNYATTYAAMPHRSRQLLARFVGLFAALLITMLINCAASAQDGSNRLQKAGDSADQRVGIQNRIPSGFASDDKPAHRPGIKFNFGQFYVWAYKIHCIDETNPELGNDDDIQTFWQVDADGKQVSSGMEDVQRQMSDGQTQYYTTLQGLFLPNKKQQLENLPQIRLMMAGRDSPLYVGNKLTVRMRLIEVDDVEPSEVADLAEQFGDKAGKIPVVGQFVEGIAEIVEAIAEEIPGTVVFPEQKLEFTYEQLQQQIPPGGEKQFRMPKFVGGGGEYEVFIRIGRGAPK